MEKRLQSIKLPRDLTLGGTKPKKTFTPNLNVARNREKSNEFLIKTEDKRKHNKKILRNKTLERPERFVQSTGIFSDGVGNDENKKVRNERSHTFRDETPNIMPMPKVKKDEWHVDNKNETKVYNDIMGSNDLSDEEEKLPFIPLSWKEADFKEIKGPINVKSEAKVEDNDDIKVDLTKLKIDNSSTSNEFQETDYFTDYNPALTLWSMPDSFAGKGLSDDPTIKTLFDYKLCGMLEGQIGRMVVRKSGKIDVFIGCIKYQIEPAHLETFTEKLVELDVNHSKEFQGIAVGQLQNKFILNPDWAHLLTDS